MDGWAEALLLTSFTKGALQLGMLSYLDITFSFGLQLLPFPSAVVGWLRAGISLFSSASNVLLEGTPRGAPSGFIEIPIHRDTRFFAERIEKGFRPGGGGK
jgi:hypothetical protein